jgi:hypothetical protein
MFSIMNSTSFRIEALALLATKAGFIDEALRTKHLDLGVLEMAREFEEKSPGARKGVISLLNRAIKRQVESSKCAT